MRWSFTNAGNFIEGFGGPIDDGLTKATTTPVFLSRSMAPTIFQLTRTLSDLPRHRMGGKTWFQTPVNLGARFSWKALTPSA